MIPNALSIAPFHFEVVDYRTFIVDFPMNLITGDEFVLIAKLSIRRLILNQLQLVDNYIQRGEKLFNHYKIPEKID